MIDYLIALSCLVAIFRLAVPGHDLSLAGSYEAMAHIWVGYLIGVFWLHPGVATRRVAFTCLVLTTVFEVLMFIAR